MRPALTSPWLKKKLRVVTMPPRQLPLHTTERQNTHRFREFGLMDHREPWLPVTEGRRIPEVGSVAEEDTHHGTVEQEHAGDVEIRRVAQTCPQTQTMEERKKNAHCQDGNVRQFSPSNPCVPVFSEDCRHSPCVCGKNKADSPTATFVGGNRRLMSHDLIRTPFQFPGGFVVYLFHLAVPCVRHRPAVGGGGPAGSRLHR